MRFVARRSCCVDQRKRNADRNRRCFVAAGVGRWDRVSESLKARFAENLEEGPALDATFNEELNGVLEVEQGFGLLSLIHI